MPGKEPQLLLCTLFDGLQKKETPPRAMDNFQNILIASYEQAIAEGAAPVAVLSIVLDWASQEMQRCTRKRDAGR
jgi:hypothetical protein